MVKVSENAKEKFLELLNNSDKGSAIRVYVDGFG